MTDNYNEHKFHEYWDKNCSECYKDRERVLNKPCGMSNTRQSNEDILGIAQEGSEHLTTYRYW